MKTVIISLVCLALGALAKANSTLDNIKQITIVQKDEKVDIKIKNDSGNEIMVINDGSGGTYRLQKNVTTTIKMEVGDKLYIYEKGKKGKLLLTASKDMVGKVQLYSKL